MLQITALQRLHLFILLYRDFICRHLGGLFIIEGKLYR